ncbi:MAG: hypothetical protein A2Y62_20515 [Candidatus Fischerbacteria bacterium RBG_13_37_8]|uniref:histidine kinase n=1 Tax=Candidatus Fischerbacteria bacterium RBG_13_37_8 TaxID=1817863 RepID=A0A1F5VEX8_9BACT|nr:MAG: hypothetical protein A2Y62_20515 [Candidatus Fischerbacteria bacterium RBG_13_37_8]
MRIKYYLIIIILIITVLPVSILTGWFLRTISNEYKQRAKIHIDQIKNFSSSAIEYKIRSLQEIIISLQDYIMQSDVDLLADLQQSNYTPGMINLASGLKSASGLDFFEIINEEGNILSSGHWTANYGQLQKAKLEWPVNVPVYHIERIIDKTYFSVQVKRTIRLGERLIYIIGGYVLDSTVMLPNYLTSEVSYMFTINLGKEEKSEADYFKEFKDYQNRVIAILEVSISMDFVNSIIRKSYQTFIIAAVVLICLSIFLGMILSKHITKPLEVLVSAASEIGKGNLDKSIEYSAKGEIARLLSAFNYMIISLREAQQKLIIAERLNAWREAARRIAHEIKNPISPIQVCIKTLIKVKDEKPYIFDELFEQSSRTILEEVAKLHSLADSFSLFAQMPNPVKREVDINSLIKQVLQLYKTSMDNVIIEEEYNEAIALVMADAKLISAALHNIIKNALEALPKEQAELRIRTLLLLENNDRWARIIISDNGKGISKEDLQMIFQPYFTTKPKGTGLGLTVAKDIIQQHNGRISVESEEGTGTTFNIDLPLEKHGNDR